MKRILPFSAILFIFLQLAVYSVKAQAITLKFDGITGSSTLSGATGLVDVESYGTSAGCASCAIVNGPGSAAGKITPGKIVFNLNSVAEIINFKSLMLAGKASTNAFFIFSKNATGTTVTGVGPATDYYVVALGNVIVLEVDESTAASNVKPTFQVSLGYGEIAYYFRAQTNTGTLGPVKQTGWNFATNTVAVDSKVALPGAY